MAGYRIGKPSAADPPSHESQRFSGLFRTHSPFCGFAEHERFSQRGVKATHKFVVFSAKGRPDSHFVIGYKSTFRFRRHHACQLCHRAVLK
jgi:hypothetical protein